jgi:chaperonin GroEL
LKLSEERQSGVGIIARAMSEPFRQIAANAGHDPAVVLGKVQDGEGDYGFNARTEQYEDLVKAGVIDPTKVVRTALENAASAATLLITTEAAVTEKPKKPAPAPAMPHGGMGGMGMGGMGGMGMGGMGGMGMGGMGGEDDFGGDDF